MTLKLPALLSVFLKHEDTKTQRFLIHFVPLCLCVVFSIILLPNLAVAAGDDTLHRQGVEAYEAGNYEQALDLFSQTVVKKPEDATALYNQGTALFKLGRFNEATQAFAASAQAYKDKKIRARAEYNQGRALLAEAGQNQDIAKKKELLLAGNQAFQQALRDDPRLLAARKGIEDFRKEYAKVNQQPPAGQEQQQKTSDQDQEDQQNLQDQLNEAGQQQQDMANQSKEANKGESQEGSSQEQLQDKAAQQQSVRQSLEQIKEELSKNQDGQSNDQQNRNDLAKKLENAINEQKKAEEALGRGDLNQAQQHQQNAADSLQELAAELAADQEDNSAQSADPAVDQDNPDQDGAQQHAADKQQEEHEAEKTDSTVTDILDGEKALHEMRRLRIRQQRPASGKDW